MAPRSRVSPGRAVSSALVLPVAFLAALPAAAQTVSDPGLQVEIVATGLTQPTSMAFIGNDDILVLQKASGQVRRIVGGVLQPGFVLDVPVHFASERGLLGIALDPDFVLNGQVYLYYTESSTGPTPRRPRRRAGTESIASGSCRGFTLPLIKRGRAMRSPLFPDRTRLREKFTGFPWVSQVQSSLSR